jgi:hypothetical protein
MSDELNDRGAEGAEGRRTSGMPCALALCALFAAALASSCASIAKSPPGYDADTTPGHDGEAWISELKAEGKSQIADSRLQRAEVRQEPEVRRAMAAHREREQFCAWCGNASRLNVHHIWPIWMRPDLAAEPRNLITLCDDCHFVLGHARNWKRAVTNIRQICNLQLVAGSTEAPR